jgi:release factor glutamine methyltransferase
MQFVRGDLFDALPRDGRKYDIITSNPPYIPTGVIATLEPEVKDHEPMLALDGSQDGLLFYRRIAAEAGAYLVHGGSIYLEIGYDQGESVSTLMREAGFENVQVFKDLAGNDRVVRADKR